MLFQCIPFSNANVQSYAIDEILVEPAYLNVAAQAEINYSEIILTVNTEQYYIITALTNSTCW